MLPCSLARGAGSSVSHRGMFRVQVGALGELIPGWGCPQSRAAELMELCVEEEDAQHHRGIKTAAPERCPRWQGKVSLSLLIAVSGMAVFGLLMLKASTKQKICWEQICPNSSKDVLSFTGIYP